MTYILRLDASPRYRESESRRLADLIQDRLLAISPHREVRSRDLSSSPIPHIVNETIEGFYAPSDAITAEQKRATSLSDELIHELKNADVLLISAPMYNFGVPSSLKAWIDQIVRINATFAFDGAEFEGLVPTNRAILALVYGASGYAPGGDFSAMNFLEPYLVSLMQFLGIKQTEVVRIEGTTRSPDTLAEARRTAAAQVSDLLANEVAC